MDILGCVHVLGIVSSVTMDIGCMYLFKLVFSCLWIYGQEWEIAMSYGTIFLAF